MTDGSLKVAQITDKQPAPSCRFTIQASLRGFPITIEGEGRAGDLKIIVDRLLAAGAEPPHAAPVSTPEPTKAAGAPNSKSRSGSPSHAPGSKNRRHMCRPKPTTRTRKEKRHRRSQSKG